MQSIFFYDNITYNITYDIYKSTKDDSSDAWTEF